MTFPRASQRSSQREYEYVFPISPKTLEEALCYAAPHLPHTTQGDMYRRVLNEAVKVIERMRPTGPDGKHGDRHTANCGCDSISKGRRRVCLYCWGKGFNRLAAASAGRVHPCTRCDQRGWTEL